MAKTKRKVIEDKKRLKAERQRRWLVKLKNDKSREVALLKYRKKECDRQKQIRSELKSKAGKNPELCAMLREKERIRKANQRKKKKVKTVQGVELSSQKKRRLLERERSRKTNERKLVRERKSNTRLRVALFRAKHRKIVGNTHAKQKIQNEDTDKNEEHLLNGQTKDDEWITIDEPMKNDNTTQNAKDTAVTEDDGRILTNEKKDQRMAQTMRDSQPSSFKSRSTEWRSRKKAKSVLPNTPSKRADVLQALINSPNTKKQLERKGVIMSDASKDKVKGFDALKDGLDDLLVETKPGQEGTTKVSRHVYSTVLSSIGKSVAKCRMKNYLTKKMQLSRKILKSSRDKRNRKKLKPRKQRKDAMSNATKLRVRKYYLSQEISRIIRDRP